MDVYVDESGDLGFTKKATSFFIIGYLACDSSVVLRTAMKRLLKQLHEKGMYHTQENELKFCRMDNQCRRTVLTSVMNSGANLGVVVVNKKSVKYALHDKLPVLYNYLVVHNIVSALIPNLENGQRINLTFDKSLPKNRIVDFNDYVKGKASYLSHMNGNSFNSDYVVSEHVDSKVEPCLQGVDAIAGAYFQKYEKNDPSYVDIIKDVTSFYYLWRK